MRLSDKSSPKSSPAYFLSLTVENIRCFGPKQTLDLSDGNGRPAPWTIILGDNGFGKTTLLQILAGLQLERDLPENSVNEEYMYPIFSQNINALRVITGHDPRQERTNPFDVSCSVYYGSKITSRKLGKINNSIRIHHIDKRFIAVLPVDPGKDSDFNELICYSYGAKRQVGSTSLVSDPERRNEKYFTDDTHLINAEEWYLQADYAAKRHSSHPEAVDRQRKAEVVKDALLRLLPSVENIEIVESELSPMNARVVATTPFGKVHIQDLSLGYRTLIAWIVDLAHRLFQRYPKSNDPFSEPAIVLVDEIDLHLHPRFQRILMNYLTGLFPNTQFIATAHSPLVVQASSNANIVLLRREGDHIVIDNDVENIENWRVDQILTSDLFGLKSARQLEVEEYELERETILGKSKLTAKDKEKLEFLESKIAALPIGETRENMKAMDIVRRLAKEIERVQENSK